MLYDVDVPVLGEAMALCNYAKGDLNDYHDVGIKLHVVNKVEQQITANDVEDFDNWGILVTIGIWNTAQNASTGRSTGLQIRTDTTGKIALRGWWYSSGVLRFYSWHILT